MGLGCRALGRFHHLVVIYQENHSFDNLYGEWGSVAGQAVDGVANAEPAHTQQVAQDGTPYACLQNDVRRSATPTARLPHVGNRAVATDKLR